MLKSLMLNLILSVAAADTTTVTDQPFTTSITIIRCLGDAESDLFLTAQEQLIEKVRQICPSGTYPIIDAHSTVEFQQDWGDEACFLRKTFTLKKQITCADLTKK